MIKLYNEDCLNAMRKMDTDQYDLAIVDPPYGINIDKWDKQRPTKEYFIQLFRVSKNQLIFGGNYFDLPITRAWICWHKVFKKLGYMGKTNVDEFELIWTSLNMKCKIINFSDVGNMYGFDGKIKVDYKFKGKIHPTQKHVELYRWILQNYAKEGDKILDTHLGSGSIAIACHDMGYSLDGYELDTEYYEAAKQRLEKHQQQLKLF
tara:strand:+ start:295 stop:912 length:618 start_codon:yes stop_codon:yes gene_type:complete